MIFLSHFFLFSKDCKNVVPAKDINNDNMKEQENNALGDNILRHGDESLKSNKSVNSNKIPSKTGIVGEMVDEITCSPNHVAKPLKTSPIQICIRS